MLILGDKRTGMPPIGKVSFSSYALICEPNDVPAYVLCLTIRITCRRLIPNGALYSNCRSGKGSLTSSVLWKRFADDSSAA